VNAAAGNASANGFTNNAAYIFNKSLYCASKENIFYDACAFCRKSSHRTFPGTPYNSTFGRQVTDYTVFGNFRKKCRRCCRSHLNDQRFSVPVKNPVQFWNRLIDNQTIHSQTEIFAGHVILCHPMYMLRFGQEIIIICLRGCFHRREGIASAIVVAGIISVIFPAGAVFIIFVRSPVV